MAGHQPAPITAAGIGDAREQPRLMAQALAEAAQHLGAATPASLEPAVKLLAGRREEPALARPLYALAAFLSEGTGVRSRLEGLGPCPPPTAASMALAGGSDHPGVGATAAPLRRALAAQAHGQAGFGPLPTRPSAGGELAISSDRREAWHALATTMAVPALELSVTEAPAEESADVAALATRPALISIPQSLLVLPDDQLTFLVARAFDRLRGGLALIDAVTSREASEVEALLRGASAALAGRTPPELPLAVAAAGELAGPERVAALVGAAPRPRVAGDLLLAEEALAGWEGFRDSAALASGRF